jgi:hypothetical protein
VGGSLTAIFFKGPRGVSDQWNPFDARMIRFLSSCLENSLLTLFSKEQINDLAVMSREYERQEAARMANHAGVEGTARHTAEPYINELIPVSQPRRRRPGPYEARRDR